MSAPPAPVTRVALNKVEQELSQRLKEAQGAGDAPVIKARMSNLVVFCSNSEQAERVSTEIPAIVAVHPARVIILAPDCPADAADIVASLRVQSHRLGHTDVCSEEIFLHACERSLDSLPFAVRSLLVGDLPTNLWWASPMPPPLAGTLLYDLAEYAQQLIYDSLGWVDPHRGVSATAPWLERFERAPGQPRWRVASDLNWRRLKYWRRLLGQSLDPNSAPGAIESITDVLVEHGPHAVTQAWELVGWLAARLGWRVQATRVQPGLQISWQVESRHGKLRVCIARLAEGPSEIRRIRIACVLDGKPVTLNCVVEDEVRLSAQPEGIATAPRTVTFQRQSVAELISRQLSDREPDPVFRESMEIARVFAQSVL
ncbi:MAG TPA: glucose-6-phosphate dehydrogenase assembly protein OpcA [Gemmataceae bacterium]|jgi:glucose-6-phosphate dehydrogenase assembly protein OpcA|nr:glucose-6-phosphate dehydrogenase assembly protein OpcA [Gemmataceae bacterium]